MVKMSLCFAIATWVYISVTLIERKRQIKQCIEK